MPLADAADYPLAVNVALFIASGAVIWASGTRLTRYLDAVAEITAIDRAFVGMFMLAVITSLPEVANVITSSYFGNPALAVNNLLGSASINILMLALADAVIGRVGVTSAVARPSTLMLGALCILALTLVAIAVTTGDVLIPGVGVGIWPLVLFAGCLTAFRFSAGYTKDAPWALADPGGVAQDPPQASDARVAAQRPTSLRPLLVKSAVAGGVLFVAGYSIAQTGDALAEQTGLGTGIVGFLLIGVSTSLPELSTITAAIRIRRHEMAIAEVLGTNLVNISLLLPADLIFAGGPLIDELGRFEILSSLLGSMLIGAYVVGFLEHRNAVVLRMGYDSLAVMIMFAAGLALLFTVG